MRFPKAVQTILLKNILKQVVNKIGSEIPTDPMPIEAGDMVVVLEPKKEWIKRNRERRIDWKKCNNPVCYSKMPHSVFSNLYKMRFNELLTGQNKIGIKDLYGENSDIPSDFLVSDGGKKI